MPVGRGGKCHPSPPTPPLELSVATIGLAELQLRTAPTTAHRNCRNEAGSKVWVVCFPGNKLVDGPRQPMNGRLYTLFHSKRDFVMSLFSFLMRPFFLHTQLANPYTVVLVRP